MNILVTGGAGYIGSVVAAELVSAGHSVTVLDDLSHGHRQAVPANAVLVPGDVADRELVQKTLAEGRIESVMHFAALIESGESMRIPESYFRNNSAGSLTLVEAMLASGVNRLVFSSTAAVYGEPQRIPIDEDDPLQPSNVYGASKLLVEGMLGWFHRTHGLRYATLRYFNAAGSSGGLGEAHVPESHLIPLTLEVALGKRESIAVYGNDYPTRDGTCVRDYLHVSDIAQAHVLALEALRERDKLIYNLGSGQGFTVREVIDIARRVTGHPIPVVEAERRAGDPAVLVASSERIKRELGWKRNYPDLVPILQSAWRWHQEHPEGYRSAPGALDEH